MVLTVFKYSRSLLGIKINFKVQNRSGLRATVVKRSTFKSDPERGLGERTRTRPLTSASVPVTGVALVADTRVGGCLVVDTRRVRVARCGPRGALVLVWRTTQRRLLVKYIDDAQPLNFSLRRVLCLGRNYLLTYYLLSH